ncbi:MAG: hypothetical protein ACRDZ5_09045 [Acidimicrobiales bacterium]
MRGQQVRGRRLATLALCAIALAASGCGAEKVVATIGATDTVVQTNLTVAGESSQTYYVETNTYTGFGTTFKPDAGVHFTVDPSSGPSEISYYLPPNDHGQALVLAAYNRATRNCYGLIEIGGSVQAPVLGMTAGGTYQFSNPHVISAGCSAGFIGEHPAPLPGWPPGDPSSSGWPKS